MEIEKKLTNPGFSILLLYLFLLSFFMETILQCDYTIFEWINHDLQNNFLDAIMPWWRSKFIWFPFYAMLIGFMVIKYKIKGLYFILALALTVGVADTMSSKVIKNSVKRLRPCKNPEIKDTTHLLVNCGSGYSFTSSHATNHFAIAFFLLFTFCRRFKYLRLPLVFWASSIAFGQVYVGVHFPLDVLGGAFLGILTGYLVFRIYNSLKQVRIADFQA
ncbi:MAG: membrane-associated phospholipid phosphatase [Saprospiraceae bacterium]